jgi:hypothetical protein
VELLDDPGYIPLGIDSKESKLAHNRDTCIPMIVSALFTIASHGIILGPHYKRNE